MKLELEPKHITPYLPYGLKVMEKVVYGKINKAKVAFVEGQININRLSEYIKFQNIKPILRPLSDLTKDDLFIINLFSNVSNLEITKYEAPELTLTATYKLMGDVFTDFIINRGSIKYTDYWIVEKLLEHHFDVFGLIKQGLAIDINTLQQ